MPRLAIRSSSASPDEIRLRRLARDSVVDLVVQRKLFGIQIHFRKHAVLVEMKIGNAEPGKKIRLSQIVELLRALKQEEQLRRKRGVSFASIEALEKRIRADFFEQQVTAQSFGKACRETGLADADRAFDDNESAGRIPAGRSGGTHASVSFQAAR